MTSFAWQAAATHEAELFVRELGIDALPVCPFSIAKELDIDVRPLPLRSRGVSGMLLRHGNDFGILYATYLDNEGFQRFCVSHELGHYRLPGHPESVLINGMHTSYAGFVSKDRFELEADHFAAGLLMPRSLFDPVLHKAGDGLDAIETLANQCVTSMTATAIRYAQRTPNVVAVVVSAGHQIDYCFMSDALKEIRGLDWLRKGSSIPRGTVTYSFNEDPNNVVQAQRADGETTIQDWFGGSLRVEMFEEVLGLGSYRKTLTVLSVSQIPNPEELEEEEELTESWTPRFRR